MRLQELTLRLDGLELYSLSGYEGLRAVCLRLRQDEDSWLLQGVPMDGRGLVVLAWLKNEGAGVAVIDFIAEAVLGKQPAVIDCRRCTRRPLPAELEALAKSAGEPEPGPSVPK